MEEITARFGREKYVFDSGERRTVIATCYVGNSTEPTTVRGKAMEDELQPNGSYRFLGRWVNHEKYGKQFHFVTFVECEPLGRRGIIAYLKQVRGIGPATAQRVYDEFGAGCLKVIREQPERIAAAIPRMSTEHAKLASKQLRERAALESVTVELLDLFASRSFAKTLVRRVISRWGNEAPRIIKENPYQLMAFSGVGFLKADRLWIDLGLDPADIRRQAYCVWHAADKASGNTWISDSTAVSSLRSNVSSAEVKPVDAFGLAKEYKLITTTVDQHGKQWVSTVQRAAEEKALAIGLAELLSEDPKWPDMLECDTLSVHQRAKVMRAFLGTVGLLTGIPGTGKTFTTAAVVREVLKRYGPANVAVCAPTGKAAVRVTEIIHQMGISVEATTIHRLLGVCAVDDSGRETGWTFAYGPGNPLPYKFIFVDEASMLDTSVASALVSACQPGTHILFIGDTNQLPPVGHGSPLLDMIAAEVPCGELTEIRRNSGQIVHTCKSMRVNGEFPVSTNWDPPSGDNLYLVRATTPARQIAALEHAIRRVREIGEFDPVWQLQVIVAVNTKSKVSRRELNRVMQGLLNPNGQGVDENPFRVGDKIINLKNSRLPSLDPDDPNCDKDGRVYVANGEQAEVIQVEKRMVFADLQNPFRQIKIPMGVKGENGNDETDDDDDKTDTGCNWDLGYAISCHRCVHPDTLIETDRGLMKIREASNSGVIGTPSGPRDYQNMVHFENRKCLRIKTSDGNEVIVTEDHNCEVWNGERYAMDEAANLRVGDFVRNSLFPSCEPAQKVVLPPKPPVDPHATKDCFVPTCMTHDLAEFLGLVVADGTVFRGGVRLSKEHNAVTYRFAELCMNLFGIQCRIYEDGKMLVAECQSSVVRDWLHSIGGCFPHAKSTPQCILASPIYIHAAFLRGLFEDGYVSEKNDKLDFIELHICFEQLRSEVKVMLNRLGIIHGTNSQKRNGRSIYIYGSEAAKFRERIGAITPYKKDRLHLPHGKQTRYIVPVSLNWLDENRAYTTKWDRQNGRYRGYLSRHVIDQIASRGCESACELLRWHHSKIKSIEKTTCPAMCVEVPDGNRFMQNGFPWGNSQGSEWPMVFVVLDHSGAASRICDRSWLYTAISRAKHGCLLIGRKSDAEQFVQRSNLHYRKTFLCEQLERARLDVAPVIEG